MGESARRTWSLEGICLPIRPTDKFSEDAYLVRPRSYSTFANKSNSGFGEFTEADVDSMGFRKTGSRKQHRNRLELGLTVETHAPEYSASSKFRNLAFFTTHTFS